MSKTLQLITLTAVFVLVIVVVVQASFLWTYGNIIKSLKLRLKAEENFHQQCNQVYINKVVELRNQYNESIKLVTEEANKKNEHLQYRIDNLMLEYCPEEITVSQFANYAVHQKKVDPNFNLVLPDTPEEEKQIQDIEYKEGIKHECD